MPASPTAYAESNAVLAALSGDLDETSRIIRTLLPNERRALVQAIADVESIIRLTNAADQEATRG